MKICSLLPSATEILFALGLGESVVGVSHECDTPPEAARLPRVVDSVVNQDTPQSSADIDRLVRKHRRERKSLYRLNLDRLRELRPDVIITQELCDVCAISAGDITHALASLPFHPKIISLHPHTLGGMFEDMLRIGAETGRADAARRVVDALRARLARVRALLADAPRRPLALCVEWLEPPMACGHWVPEMVQMAGGQDVIGQVGRPSRRMTWEEIAAGRPEFVILMPCGFPIERTRKELSALTSHPEWAGLPAVQAGRVFLVNGPAYFNRSGPRLVDGVEILAGLLHPDRAAQLMPPGSAEPL